MRHFATLALLLLLTGGCAGMYMGGDVGGNRPTADAGSQQTP